MGLIDSTSRFTFWVSSVCLLCARDVELAASNDACMQVSWDNSVAGHMNTASVHPLTRFPEHHYLRSNTVCEQTFSSDDLLPATTMWALTAGEEQCEEVSGAEAFFAFQLGSPLCPTAYCSLTGLQKPDTLVIYLLRDASGATSLVFHADAASTENADGGNLKLYIEAVGANNRGVRPLVYDDLGARNASDGSWYGFCANVARDCHSWDTALGKGYFSWSWGPRSADGMVLGPFPTDPYKIAIRPIALLGLSHVEIVSQDDMTGQLHDVEIDLSELNWQQGLTLTVPFDCRAVRTTTATTTSTTPIVQQLARSACSDVAGLSCGQWFSAGDCADTHDEDAFLGAACPITCAAGCAVAGSSDPAPGFSRLDVNERCDKDDLESRARRFSLGGDGHTLGECYAACEAQDTSCNAFTLSKTGFCHMFASCQSRIAVSNWVTFLRVSPSPTSSPTTAAPTQEDSIAVIAPPSIDPVDDMSLSLEIFYSTNLPLGSARADFLFRHSNNSEAVLPIRPIDLEFVFAFRIELTRASGSTTATIPLDFLRPLTGSFLHAIVYVNNVNDDNWITAQGGLVSAASVFVGPNEIAPTQRDTNVPSFAPTSDPTSRPTPSPVHFRTPCEGLDDSIICGFVDLSPESCAQSPDYLTLCPIGCNVCETTGPTPRPTPLPSDAPTSVPTTGHPTVSPSTNSPSSASSPPTHSPTVAEHDSCEGLSDGVLCGFVLLTPETCADNPTYLTLCPIGCQSCDLALSSTEPRQTTTSTTYSSTTIPPTEVPSSGAPSEAPSTLPPTLTPTAYPTSDCSGISDGVLCSFVVTTPETCADDPSLSTLCPVSCNTCHLISSSTTVSSTTTMTSSKPTFSPTAPPSTSPTPSPTTKPSVSPTSSAPTNRPTAAPSGQPSSSPTTSRPSQSPSELPTQNPTPQPSFSPITVPPSPMSPTTAECAGFSDSPLCQFVLVTSETCESDAALTILCPISCNACYTTRTTTVTTMTTISTRHPTAAPSINPSARPTSSPTWDPSQVPTRTPTQIPTTVPSTQKPSFTPSLAPTTIPLSTSPTRTQTINPSVRPTLFPSSFAPMSDVPTRRPTYSKRTHAPSLAPTTEPTESLRPSLAPTFQPTTTPTGVSTTVDPTVSSSPPTRMSTTQPTMIPTSRPTTTPSIQPSQVPSVHPTILPTGTPTVAPSSRPTRIPTTHPTAFPTVLPSGRPTITPSVGPTPIPTVRPNMLPSMLYTGSPTAAPSSSPMRMPTTHPTMFPTELLTDSPTLPPSVGPTRIPSVHPTMLPTDTPTVSPTRPPTRMPIAHPTMLPSVGPTPMPTVRPTMLPSTLYTGSPTAAPSSSPMRMPTTHPTMFPTELLTDSPTLTPSVGPTRIPSVHPTTLPIDTPSAAPSSLSTRMPTTQPTLFPTGLSTDTPTATPVETTRRPTVPAMYPTMFPAAFPPTTTPTAQSNDPITHVPTARPSLRPTGMPSIRSHSTSTPSLTPTTHMSSTESSTPATCKCRAGVISPVCHISTQTSYSNLCLAWCAGHFNTEPGLCTPIHIQTPAPVPHVCTGQLLGYFTFTTFYKSSVFAATDTELFVEQVNSILHEAGSPQVATCATVNPSEGSISVFSTRADEVCESVGWALADFSAFGTVAVQISTVIIAVAQTYTIQCAYPTISPSTSSEPLSTTPIFPSGTSTTVPDGTDISSANGSQSEASALSDTHWIVVFLMIFAILGVIIAVFECNHQRVKTEHKRRLLALLSGQPLSKPTKNNNPEQSIIDQLEDDNAWLHASPMSQSSGRLTNDRIAWESPLQSPLQNESSHQGNSWATWHTPSEYLSSDPHLQQPPEADLYIAIKTGPRQRNPDVMVHLRSPLFSDDGDTDIYSVANKPQISENAYDVASNVHSVAYEEDSKETIYELASDVNFDSRSSTLDKDTKQLQDPIQKDDSESDYEMPFASPVSGVVCEAIPTSTATIRAVALGAHLEGDRTQTKSQLLTVETSEYEPLETCGKLDQNQGESGGLSDNVDVGTHKAQDANELAEKGIDNESDHSDCDTEYGDGVADVVNTANMPTTDATYAVLSEFETGNSNQIGVVPDDHVEELSEMRSLTQDHEYGRSNEPKASALDMTISVSDHDLDDDSNTIEAQIVNFFEPLTYAPGDEHPSCASENDLCAEVNERGDRACESDSVATDVIRTSEVLEVLGMVAEDDDLSEDNSDTSDALTTLMHDFFRASPSLFHPDQHFPSDVSDAQNLAHEIGSDYINTDKTAQTDSKFVDGHLISDENATKTEVKRSPPARSPEDEGSLQEEVRATVDASHAHEESEEPESHVNSAQDSSNQHEDEDALTVTNTAYVMESTQMDCSGGQFDVTSNHDSATVISEGLPILS